MPFVYAYFCAEDVAKLQFSLNAVLMPDPFGCEGKIGDDVSAAIEWHAQRSPAQVIAEREAVICDIERRANLHRYV